MPNPLPSYYWDACIFLEHLREEPVDATKSQAIKKFLEINKDKKNVIFTSSLTHIEVLPKKITVNDQKKEDQYMGYFNSNALTPTEAS